MLRVESEVEMNDASLAAEVLLKLYELRTEPSLRQARAWFAFEFHPSTARDVSTSNGSLPVRDLKRRLAM